MTPAHLSRRGRAPGVVHMVHAPWGSDRVHPLAPGGKKLPMRRPLPNRVWSRCPRSSAAAVARPQSRVDAEPKTGVLRADSVPPSRWHELREVLYSQGVGANPAATLNRTRNAGSSFCGIPRNFVAIPAPSDKIRIGLWQLFVLVLFPDIS